MAINADFIVLEDGTKAKKAGEMVYEGSPLTLHTDGSLKLAGPTDKVYGLSKLDSNSYRDFAFGEFGAFGSGQLTVVVQGQVSVSPSIFNQIEITTATLPVGSTVVVPLYDDSKDYVPGQALYVATVTGVNVISNTPSDNTSLFARVLQPHLHGTGGALVIELLPMASTVKTEMK